jgi:RNA ligase (TIGR02306 family)
MSTFLVEIKTIAGVQPHPNADRLEIISFSDLAYNLVAGRDSYQAGDRIIYLPLDSQLPTDLIEELGVGAYLSGPDHNVVQTAILRGAASQGIPAPLSVLERRGIPLDTPNEQLAGALGIVKYDPEPKEAENAILYPLPGNRHSYDIENAERYFHMIDYILENRIPVIVTEKLEGCHVGAYHEPAENEPHLFIRNNRIVENEGEINPICQLLRNCGIEQLAFDLAMSTEHPISIHAEALGAGSGRDYYRIGDSRAPVFDIGIKKAEGWTYLSDTEFTLTGVPSVPVLFRGQLSDFLNGRSVVEASHGVSALNPKKLREGIVIKPLVEQMLPLELGGGRLIIKQRDPIYLGKNK